MAGIMYEAHNRARGPRAFLWVYSLFIDGLGSFHKSWSFNDRAICLRTSRAEWSQAKIMCVGRECTADDEKSRVNRFHWKSKRTLVDFVAIAPVTRNHPVFVFPSQSQPQVRKLTTRAHIKGNQWEKQARTETALLININTIRHDELN